MDVQDARIQTVLGTHPTFRNTRKEKTIDDSATLALIGMLVIFGLPLGLVGIILYYKHRRTRILHETVARLAERGMPVPPELLVPARRRTGLQAGLVLLAMGIGMAVFFVEVGLPWSIGLIPGLMGAALLLAWKIETSRS